MLYLTGTPRQIFGELSGLGINIDANSSDSALNALRERGWLSGNRLRMEALSSDALNHYGNVTRWTVCLQSKADCMEPLPDTLPDDSVNWYREGATQGYSQAEALARLLLKLEMNSFTSGVIDDDR